MIEGNLLSALQELLEASDAIMDGQPASARATLHAITVLVNGHSIY